LLYFFSGYFLKKLAMNLATALLKNIMAEKPSLPAHIANSIWHTVSHFYNNYSFNSTPFKQVLNLVPLWNIPAKQVLNPILLWNIPVKQVLNPIPLWNISAKQVLNPILLWNIPVKQVLNPIPLWNISAKQVLNTLPP
jgi:hypothetical protein